MVQLGDDDGRTLSLGPRCPPGHPRRRRTTAPGRPRRARGPDPWREKEELDQAVRDVEAGGGTIEVFDYPGSGHLFSDPTLPAEYDPLITETFWSRALPFVRACGLTAESMPR